jgi:phage terminase small subunit
MHARPEAPRLAKLKPMPILSNPRHERFAQALAEGKSATEAYEVAGYSPNDGNAARMKGNDRIMQRVAELQKQAAKRSVITLESLIAEAGDIQTKALAKGHYSAAVAALIAKAKLSGHWVDRGENKTSNVIYAISDRELTEEEWFEKYCRPSEGVPHNAA